MTTDAADLFDPKLYFVTRLGFDVWPEVIDNFIMTPTPRRDVGKITTIDHSGIFGLHRSDQMELLGGEVEARRCAFTVDQIARLIDAQSRKDLPTKPLPNRLRRGPLASNHGRLNILYTVSRTNKLFGVYIGWNCGWHVIGGRPFLHNGFEGVRLFRQHY